jgi:hypothetical protein
LIGANGWKGEWRRRGIRARSAPAQQRKERERGAQREKKGPDGWGHPVSVRRKKEKRGRRAGLLREGVDGQMGRCGLKGM